MKKFFIISLVITVFYGFPLWSQPLNPIQLHGRWQLKYRGNYGYMFHFYKNFRALCVIYLNHSAVVFKGIYTVEADNTLRINIYEMKNSSSSGINYHSNFVKTTSTYLLFNAERTVEGSSHLLLIKPKKIMIDGRSSDGYFEPMIKLKKY
mgnify:CR=1 FL=1